MTHPTHHPGDTVTDDRLRLILGWHVQEAGECIECGHPWPCDTRRMTDGSWTADTDPIPAPGGPSGEEGHDWRNRVQAVACSWRDAPPCTRFEASSCYHAVSALIDAGYLAPPRPRRRRPGQRRYGSGRRLTTWGVALNGHGGEDR